MTKSTSAKTATQATDTTVATTNGTASGATVAVNTTASSSKPSTAAGTSAAAAQPGTTATTFSAPVTSQEAEVRIVAQLAQELGIRAAQVLAVLQCARRVEGDGLRCWLDAYLQLRAELGQPFAQVFG